MTRFDRPCEITMDAETTALAYEYRGQRGRPTGSPEFDGYRTVDETNRQGRRYELGLG